MLSKILFFLVLLLVTVQRLHRCIVKITLFEGKKHFLHFFRWFSALINPCRFFVLWVEDEIKYVIMSQNDVKCRDKNGTLSCSSYYILLKIVGSVLLHICVRMESIITRAVDLDYLKKSNIPIFILNFLNTLYMDIHLQLAMFFLPRKMRHRVNLEFEWNLWY